MKTLRDAGTGTKFIERLPSLHGALGSIPSLIVQWVMEQLPNLSTRDGGRMISSSMSF